EVVLAGEDRGFLNGATERQPGTDRGVHGGAIEDRQRPGQADAHGADMSIGLAAERAAAAAEDFRRGQQLSVNLEADDRLKFHGGHTGKVEKCKGQRGKLSSKDKVQSGK